jgi:hypothetical protein
VSRKVVGEERQTRRRGEGVLSAAIEEQLIGTHMAPLAWRHGSAAKRRGGEIPEGISEVSGEVPGQYRLKEDVWNVCCPPPQ